VYKLKHLRSAESDVRWIILVVINCCYEARLVIVEVLPVNKRLVLKTASEKLFVD
jgi:hypothetical protein